MNRQENAKRRAKSPALPNPHLLRQERSDDANAFFPDPGEGPAHVKDDLGQELAEEFLIAGTSGEQVTEDILNEEVPEELGGPFVSSSVEREPGGSEHRGRRP